MLKLNKCTETKPKPTLIFKNCSYMCAYQCAQLSYTAQHRTVLIIFPLILHTIFINSSDDVYWRGGGPLVVL